VTTVTDRSRNKPLRKDAAENKQRLLDAASQVFAEQGVSGSVDEVVRIAGLGMGTLYRHFPTKEALISELVRGLLADVILDAHRALQPRDGNGLATFLYAAGEHQSSQRGCLARLWGPRVAPDLMEDIRDLIAELLVDAHQHGQVRDDVSATDITVIVWALRGVIETTRSVAPDAWRRHLGIVLDGLRPTSVVLPGSPLTKKQMDEITNSDQATA
jgi:AcrR family transcriptional regulator